MRIAYLQPMIFPNRFAHSIQVIHTCRALAERGARVTLYVQALDSDPESALGHYGLQPHPNLTLRPLPVWLAGGRWRGPLFRAKVRRICRALIREREPCILMIREPDIAERVNPIAHRLGLPVVIEAHRGRLFEAGPPDKAPVEPGLLAEIQREQDCYRAAAGVVCITEAHRRALADWGVAVPTCVIPDGVDPTPPAEAPRDIDVLYAGQLYPWKGVGTAIAAMQFLPGRSLTIVGGNDPGQLADHRRLASALGLADRVQFVGQVPPPEVRAYLARARVGVIPLPSAGFAKARDFTSPLKLFEYMAAGLAIVGSDLPSLREILRHEENALLVPPDDPRALAEGLRRMLEDASLAERLSAAARRDVQQYTWPRRAERLLDFADRVLKALSEGGIMR